MLSIVTFAHVELVLGEVRFWKKKASFPSSLLLQRTSLNCQRSVWWLLLWCDSHIWLSLAVCYSSYGKARKSVASGDGQVMSSGPEILRTVSVPDAFLFFTDSQTYTGQFATSMADLCDKLDKIPLKSVEFHFQRGDFEKWIGTTLGDEDLAGKLKRIDRVMRGEELRIAIKEIVRKRLEELGRSV